MEQAAYLTSLKSTIKQGEIIVLGDFSENYLFLVQDATQGFHWDNSQWTLYPFLAYFKDESYTLQHQSYCFVSNDLRHISVMVHTFIGHLVNDLKEKHALKKIIYFSDGCAAQYIKLI